MFRRVLGRRKARVEREASERDRGEVAVGEAKESVTEEKVSEGLPRESSRARVLHPDEAAGALSLSLSSLRRYAADYEGVFDELPRYEGRRVFSTEALERLRAAQALLRAKQAPSLKQALLRVKDEPGPVAALDEAGDAGTLSRVGEAEGSSTKKGADHESDGPATPPNPPEVGLERGEPGTKERALMYGGLHLTLELGAGGWRLAASGGAGEQGRVLALVEALVRGAELEAPG